MKIITRMELKEGMILGEDVLFNGEVLFPEDSIVDEHIISRFKRYNIMTVSIKEAVDMAKTRYQKMLYDPNYQAFEKEYNRQLFFFKRKMGDFITKQIHVSDEELLEIYYSIAKLLPNSTILLDYLYTMIPNEDELTYNQFLSSALLAGALADWLSMNEEKRKTLILCGFYYDIGKLAIPYPILWKPEKLTKEEFEQVKQHTSIGYDYIKNLNIRQSVKNCVLMHHERMDGSGYPLGLTKDFIDPYAKYISIVDTYIAMASARSYRNAFHPLKILSIFESSMDKYDVEILMPIMKRIADSQIGNTVRLSDGSEWEIFIIHPNAFSRPILKNDKGQIMDLMENHSLEID